jgi:hypothetical protein
MALGAIKRDQNWLSSPILNRGAIGWNERGQFQISRLQITEFITTSNNQKYPISTFNSALAQTGIARYDRAWGKSYTPLQANELITTIRQNRITYIVPANAPAAPVPIPDDGYLIIARGESQTTFNPPVGTSVSLQRQVTPNDLDRYPHILAAGPWLVQSGQSVLDGKGEQFSDNFVKEAAVRSAIAIDKLGTINLVTVHHRTGGKGPTLAEMTKIVQQLGAIDALNLDGGSSSNLYLGGQTIDRASATAARVHNGIGILLPD